MCDGKTDPCYPSLVLFQTHTSAVDESGMAIALTSTINLIWGSRILDQETGIILNDEMDDFSRPGIPNAFGLSPSPCQWLQNFIIPRKCCSFPPTWLLDNYPDAGKRPLSSIAPTIIEHLNGSFNLALGASGGSLIFGSIVQVILGLNEGLDVSAAVERPRLHDQLFPSTVIVESSFTKHLVESLRDRGHNITGKPPAHPPALTLTKVATPPPLRNRHQFGRVGSSSGFH
jgi:gamma-glutamyltranspeptidase / glutathione hydrolase / leukotriene-C4 hydrolase